MRYVVIDSRRDGTGDIFTTEFEQLEEAVTEAQRQWNYLTEREQEQRLIIVVESVNPDEDAEDHLDGDVVWGAEA